MSSKTKEMIENYVEAYNSFDVSGMVKLLHQNILFRNYANGEVNVETYGIQAFKELAEKSIKTFSSRRQNIMEYRVREDKIEVFINYEGILAVDLPNGLKTGNKLRLKGKSVFQFEEGKISRIEDYS
ncbi:MULTISPECIES: nuclear transport factor 2 family protein [unclassified Paenibacillus]|uniref:nuclear transport factor 2 family protein n=1 Tax=unclassified Paenibacillus TaxID=185978 RepID=UPI000838040C|nr:nuclear transport factor 2 family protein [Paenibacillus sp. 79R4]